MHGENAYIVVAQKSISCFAKTISEPPNMEHVNMYMKWLKCDHVLSNQTHFMFCETIQNATIIEEDNLNTIN